MLREFNFKTLRARLAVFDRESAFLSSRATPEASSLNEAIAWSLDPGLEAMESEQFSLSLPPSTERHRADSGNGFLCNPGWRIFCLPWPPTLRISGAASLDALPHSGQEAWSSPAYTELVDVLVCATEELSLDWSDESRKSQSSKLDERIRWEKIAFLP